MSAIPLTARGAERLQAELHRLKTVDRPEVIKLMRWTKSKILVVTDDDTAFEIMACMAYKGKQAVSGGISDDRIRDVTRAAGLTWYNYTDHQPQWFDWMKVMSAVHVKLASKNGMVWTMFDSYLKQYNRENPDDLVAMRDYALKLGRRGPPASFLGSHAEILLCGGQQDSAYQAWWRLRDIPAACREGGKHRRGHSGSEKVHGDILVGRHGMR